MPFIGITCAGCARKLAYALLEHSKTASQVQPIIGYHKL